MALRSCAFDGAEIDAGPSLLSRVFPLLLDVVFVPSSGPAAHGVDGMMQGRGPGWGVEVGSFRKPQEKHLVRPYG